MSSDNTKKRCYGFESMLQDKTFSDLTLLVGPDEKEFYCHRVILCQQSEFFKKACTGEFTEAKTGVVKLPETDVKGFEYILRFFYSGTIDTAKDIPDLKTWMRLLQMSDMLIMPDFQAYLIERVHEMMKKDQLTCVSNVDKFQELLRAINSLYSFSRTQRTNLRAMLRSFVRLVQNGSTSPPAQPAAVKLTDVYTLLQPPNLHGQCHNSNCTTQRSQQKSLIKTLFKEPNYLKQLINELKSASSEYDQQLLVDLMEMLWMK